jgi:NAD(P)-dependent dehydrogenase (short-subunit alcohol dehydrogenase family)
MRRLRYSVPFSTLLASPLLPLKGKIVLLTGASSGIGLATAHELARLGAHLLLVCRNEARGEETRAAVQQATGPAAAVDLLLCDLSSLAQVHRLCDTILARYTHLYVLINNAGVLPDKFTVTDEGHELCWVTNHLSAFVLTNRLLPLLHAAQQARIITVTSEAHRLGQIEAVAATRNDPEKNSAFTAYCDSKLANVLFTKGLAQRLEFTNVVALCLHPGLVRSNLFSGNSSLVKLFLRLLKPFAQTPEYAAEHITRLAILNTTPKHNGNYFKKLQPASASKRGVNDTEIHRLWRISAAETGVAE